MYEWYNSVVFHYSASDISCVNVNNSGGGGERTGIKEKAKKSQKVIGAEFCATQSSLVGLYVDYKAISLSEWFLMNLTKEPDQNIGINEMS